MADAYGRVSGRVGVATLRQGPGLTNATTALTEAAKARTPLVVTGRGHLGGSGPVQLPHRPSRTRRGGRSGGRARPLARLGCRRPRPSMGASSSESGVPCSSASPSTSRRAEAPQVELTPPELTDVSLPRPGRGAPGRGPAAEARARVVLAGRGAVLSEAGPALESLEQRIGALMATSANGHGLFAGNPWSLGISGGFAPPMAAGLLRRPTSSSRSGLADMLDHAARRADRGGRPRRPGRHRRRRDRHAPPGGRRPGRRCPAGGGEA